jgi:U-box domain
MQEQSSSSSDIDIPEKFTCPITQELMQDPVMSRYGQSYERSAIIEWLAAGNKACPMTRQPLCLRDVISNPKLRVEIRRWQVENQTDVTVLMQSGDGQEDICGFIDIPAKEFEDTERTEEDQDFVLEEPLRVQSMRRSSSSRHRRRSRRQSQPQPEEPSQPEPTPIETATEGRSNGTSNRGFFRRLRCIRATAA